uniref:Uncharacterized protein n=1 Tax=Anguilla anguilla TaxID=7936 RepID=A0A0E9XM74_ANGAN
MYYATGVPVVFLRTALNQVRLPNQIRSNCATSLL